MSFEIRKYTEEEFEMVRDWGNKEGWNEGVYDYLAFKQIDKDGFWMGVLNGEPIASLCAVQYNPNFAFVGLYIAKPQFRGKGYGYQVWKHALSRINAKNLALEGVLQQQHNYTKSGFKTSHKTFRYSTMGTNKHKQSQYIVECKDIDIQELCAYDRLNFPAERKQFLKKWINLPQSKAIAVVKEGKIQGYGVLRRSHQGYRIGPLFADSFQVANQLLQNFLGSVSQQEKVSIDIPQINLEALKLVQQFKMIPGFVCARMYTNGMPDIKTHKTVYGVTSIQFG